MKKIITYVMIFTMLITTAAVSMAVPASASVKKQSKRQVTLIRSYNKIYRKCKKITSTITTCILKTSPRHRDKARKRIES